MTTGTLVTAHYYLVATHGFIQISLEGPCACGLTLCTQIVMHIAVFTIACLGLAAFV